MRAADASTIKLKGISSIELMEMASLAFVNAFIAEFPNHQTTISIICGQGNNGGDGLAIARLLKQQNYNDIQVYLVKFSEKESEDYGYNLARLIDENILIKEITEPDDINAIKSDVVIDGILGSGLNQPLAGNYQELAERINSLNTKVVAIDIPTGFNGEGVIADEYIGVKADVVICFQRPKINFFLPESAKAMGRFIVVDIGLDEDFIEQQISVWKLVTAVDAANLIKPRANFTHKGTYGHALILAGNTTTMGAALLAANACLHTGAGLTTVCLPQSGLVALNTALPEVMVLIRTENLTTENFEKYNAIAIGPGLGLEQANQELLAQIIELKMPLLIDADALTILSNREDLFDKIPAGSILTPHLKEFDRLFGTHKNWWERVETASTKAKELQVIIVLKNQYTFICVPSGEVYINPTGNPSMASGGMGDVLSGIITALLAQNYTAEQSAILGVYLHGKAGDDLAKNSYVVTASALATQISKTMKKLLLKSKKCLLLSPK